jgi:Na+-transporting NADH:ubiquinone oxidoreductase subunit E
LGITFIITGLMAIGFMSFGGMLTTDGKKEESKTEEVSTKTEVLKQEKTESTQIVEVSKITKE